MWKMWDVLLKGTSQAVHQFYEDEGFLNVLCTK